MNLNPVSFSSTHAGPPTSDLSCDVGISRQGQPSVAGSGQGPGSKTSPASEGPLKVSVINSESFDVSWPTVTEDPLFYKIVYRKFDSTDTLGICNTYQKSLEIWGLTAFTNYTIILVGLFNVTSNTTEERVLHKVTLSTGDGGKYLQSKVS